MQLAAIRTSTAQTSAAVRVGSDWALIDGVRDVSELVGRPGWRDLAAGAIAAGARVPDARAELSLPVPSPSKIVCCGLNYRAHIVETGRPVPAYPTLFAKFAETLTGPFDDIVVEDSEAVDWEAELVVVVGKRIRRADRSAARAAILGYTVANDISMRDWQSRTLQWFQGKAFDATTPVGPVVVTADEIDPADGLEISCTVDGRVVQSSSTGDLVFDAPALVSYISTFTALGPGDLVLTGTPGGVGMAREPQEFLRDGDVVATSIAGIGELSNPVRLAPAGAPQNERERT